MNNTPTYNSSDY